MKVALTRKREFRCRRAGGAPTVNWGYVPDAADTNKQFRNIRVEVDLANVKVRARKGYYPFHP